MIEVYVEDKKMYKKMWSKFMADKVVKLCGVAYMIADGERIYHSADEEGWLFRLRKAE